MNRMGCLLGMLVGFLSFVLQYVTVGSTSLFGIHPFVWSFVLSALACILGSRLAPRQSTEVLEVYFGDRTRSRKEKKKLQEASA